MIVSMMRTAWQRIFVGIWLLFGIVPAVFAELPTWQVAQKNGAWLSLIVIYVKEAGLTLGLILSVLCFAWTAYAALSKFDECRKNKAEWAELGILVVVGCGMLMFVTLLLQAAKDVIG
ncbi:MAG: TIGR03745 family integrating conjugative element membrane protein [Gammaproteobacteria bacterium]|nr:TIGR03745 family integrating conjugative element membrane protein [Gammaproteobacteria bacterium]